MKIEKLEYESFLKWLHDFFNDSKNANLLIRGYFGQDKLTTVLQYINYNNNIKSGTFVVRDIGEVPRLFGPSFKSGKFHKVNMTDKYDLVGASVDFKKWDRDYDLPYGYGEDFCIFYPVEGLLFDEKSTQKFIKKFSNSRAKKNIILTTNDYSKRAEKLYPFVDKVINLDTSEFNKEKYETLKNNFKSDNKELPY